MNLKNIDVNIPAESLIPEVYFYDEYSFDQDEILKIKKIQDVANVALKRIYDIQKQTEGENGYSGKELNSTAKAAMAELRKWTDSIAE